MVAIVLCSTSRSFNVYCYKNGKRILVSIMIKLGQFCSIVSSRHHKIPLDRAFSKKRDTQEQGRVKCLSKASSHFQIPKILMRSMQSLLILEQTPIQATETKYPYLQEVIL